MSQKGICWICTAADPRTLLYYERLRTRRWPAVALLNSDDVCDGCHMKQPPFVGQGVDRNAKIVEAGGKAQSHPFDGNKTKGKKKKFRCKRQEKSGNQ